MTDLSMVTLSTTLDALLDAGWFVKISSAARGPDPVWRCWLSWRQGDMPHKEESKKCATLDEAALWFRTTASTWNFDEEDA